jgi:hypothetical protein
VVTVVYMVAGFHVSVFVVTIEVSFCLMSHPGLLVCKVTSELCWWMTSYIDLLGFGGVPREYCGIPSCDVHAASQ